MPHEHAALCLLYGPAVPHLGPETTRYRDWKARQKTVVVAYTDDITIFVAMPTDVPVISDAIMLRKSHESLPEHTKIEESCGGRIEYIHGYSEHTIPR